MPQTRFSSLNWILAAQPFIRMVVFSVGLNNRDVWVDAICSLGFVEQKDV